MPQTLQFELTTPERIVLKEETESVTLPTQEGEITVLPGHIPLVAALAPGMMTVRKKNGTEEYLAVSGGFAEVQPGNKIIILADTAERAEELDFKKVEEAREWARRLLIEKRQADDVSSAAAVKALERELARIKVLRKYHAKKSHGPGPNIGE